MRAPFTDEWNSYWHLVFGMLSVYMPIIVPIFILYQFVLKYDENSFIDTFEYVMGATTYTTIRWIGEIKIDGDSVPDTLQPT